MEQLIRPSVMALPLLVDGRPLLDIGSGVGLPGLPLALARPARPVHLVEPRPQCTGLIHWLLDRLPPLNVSVHQADAAALNQHSLPPFQVLTRAALDWSLLKGAFYPDRYPIIRWSGPEVDPPPPVANWTAHRLRLQWKQTSQEFAWWGPAGVFHVKHSGAVTLQQEPAQGPPEG